LVSQWSDEIVGTEFCHIPPALGELDARDTSSGESGRDPNVIRKATGVWNGEELQKEGRGLREIVSAIEGTTEGFQNIYCIVTLLHGAS
jgi:hypothetical protein